MCNQLVFSPDGKILATVSADRIVFWDPIPIAASWSFSEYGPISLRDIAFSPDGQLVGGRR